MKAITYCEKTEEDIMNGEHILCMDWKVILLKYILPKAIIRIITNLYDNLNGIFFFTEIKQTILKSLLGAHKEDPRPTKKNLEKGS